MKRVFYIILTTFSLSACIYCEFPGSFLVNETGQDIVVIVRLDTSVSKKYYPNSPCHMLHYFGDDSTCTKISIDPVNFIGTYLLKNKHEVDIHGGWAKPDKSTMFTYMEIRTSKDTIILNSEKAIVDKLVQDPKYGRLFYLTLK